LLLISVCFRCCEALARGGTPELDEAPVLDATEVQVPDEAPAPDAIAAVVADEVQELVLDATAVADEVQARVLDATAVAEQGGFQEQAATDASYFLQALWACGAHRRCGLDCCGMTPAWKPRLHRDGRGSH
jgi:hypothetical protein